MIKKRLRYFFSKKEKGPSSKIQSFLSRYKIKWIIGGSLLITYIFCLPNPLFKDPTSTVLLDQAGQLLGARIAKDGQWRFPYTDSIPAKFKTAIIHFEDKRFYYHPGVDPLAMARALKLNVSRGEVVSGGSTLSMQVIRLARKGQARTVLEKLYEIVLATRLEIRHSKDEILALYAAYAPFGGNVVGLEAAAWKYYGRESKELSWSEMCTLAVLPNAPSLIHPGKNRDILLRKRDFLLQKLYQANVLDSTTLELAKLEKLPGRPLPLPRYAPHLLERIHQSNLRQNTRETITRATLRAGLQGRANEIVKRHHQHLSQNGIHNAAALIIEVETGDVLAYVGNTPCNGAIHGCTVDIVHAHRSSGSILKPLLYASMLSDGKLLPNTLVADVPSYYGGFSPTNFNRTYQGAVPASRALARSLNIPTVHMLNQYGIAKFYQDLLQLGMTSLVRPSSEYGLTLILGGAEATLWDLGSIYASMARTLANYNRYQGKYESNAYRELNFLQSETRSRILYEEYESLNENALLNAASIWHTFEAMVEVNRPETESFWRSFGSSHKIAWKTGTSYGYRDAWAIGCTPDYVVAVWVGNADGEGRPGLVGTSAAAPIMFDLFDAVDPPRTWFEPPLDDMEFIPICKESGHRLGENCPESDTSWVPRPGLKSLPCTYHKLVHLDAKDTYRVHSECESPLEMRHEVYFILPPTQEFHYRNNHPNYEPLPPYRADCEASLATSNSSANMEIIYPAPNAKIYIPIDLDGNRSSAVFEAAHRNPNGIIYWHLDETYLGQTTQMHEKDVFPKAGFHTLTLVDQDGNRLIRKFEILTKDEK